MPHGSFEHLGYVMGICCKEQYKTNKEASNPTGHAYTLGFTYSSSLAPGHWKPHATC